LEIQYEKRYRLENANDIGENAQQAFISGYMMGADVKFWFAIALVGVSFGVGVILGMLI